MRWHKADPMLSSVNDYSHLQWPITFASILTTLLAFILLLSFRSDAWFTYELIHIDNQSTVSNTTSYSRVLEYGSLGLWTICMGRSDDPKITCSAWTEETRPHSFNVLMVLLACALFLSNLTVFPSWGSSILILYNTNNRYIRHIVGFIWILLLLTLSFTVLLIAAMLLTTLTKLYSPGKFIIDTKYLYFHTGQGFVYAVYATVLAIVCLILVFTTLIWKQMIEMKLIEAEKDLLKQLSDDSYQPGWHKIALAPRKSSTNDNISQPPPYEH